MSQSASASSNSLNSVDVNTFFDDKPLSFRQICIFASCFMVLIFDGFDTVAMGFIAPSLVDGWGIQRQDLGPVMMSSMFGLALGSIIAGPLADRFGRKVVILTSVFFFGLWSWISAYSHDITTLTLYRFLTGLGLGASMPNTATLAAEFAPKRLRSFCVTCIYCGFTVGAAIGGLGSDWLIRHFGWPSVLVAGGIVPMVLIIPGYFLMPESIRFLMLNKEKNFDKIRRSVGLIAPELVRQDTDYYTSEVSVQSNNSMTGLFAPEYRIGTILLWITLFNCLLSVYLLANWLPLIVRDAGMTLTQAAVIGALFQAGGAIGNFSVGWFMDRFEHHNVVRWQCFIGMLTLVVLYFVPQTMTFLGPIILILGTTINSQTSAVNALTTSFYPTQMRSTGTSWGTGIGRFGAIVAGGVGAMLLAANLGSAEIFMMLNIPVGIALVALTLKRKYNP